MEDMRPAGFVSFTVYGDPVPKGSMRAFSRKKDGVVVGVGVAPGNEKRAKDWTGRVHAAAQLAGRDGAPMLEGPLHIIVHFWLTKPKSAPKRRTWPAKRPDLDKLVRGLLDPLTGVLFVDDAQIVSIVATKEYAEHGRQPGCDVNLWPVGED